jgi:acetyltransferase-like isoleucine patch superfamily enzyme
MSGRSLFARADPALGCLARAAAFLPAVLRRGLWHLFDGELGLAGTGARYVLARSLAAGCLENVYFGPGVTVVGWDMLTVGRNVSVHRGAYIDARGGVSIGSDVSIAHEVSIVSFEHGYEDLSLPIKYNPLRFARVSIADDVWIGCGARILAGVSIGRRSVVAAGAVVAADVPAGAMVGGVPARVLKTIA